MPGEQKSLSPRGWTRLFLSLVTVGFMLLGCCLCGGSWIGYGIWHQFFPLVGTWEAQEKVLGQDVRRELQFDVTGTGYRHVTVFKHGPGGKDQVLRGSFEYSFTRGNPSILEIHQFRPDGSKNSHRVEVTFEGNTMTLSDPELKAKPGGSLTYRRIR